jgi:hypothetical protein
MEPNREQIIAAIKASMEADDGMISRRALHKLCLGAGATTELDFGRFCLMVDAAEREN